PLARFRPTNLIHGADYYPEQWRHVPGIWDADMRLFPEAKLNTATLGVFAWTELEPAEGDYQFAWMDEIMDRLHASGQRVLLATPSGAKPNWMAVKYPEIRRVGENGQREPQGFRHNHCLTSPVYREKVGQINTRLAQRYGRHPALLGWHISNEYGGYCYCPLCKASFRDWLREKYVTLDALNDAWWSRFWSHRYTAWEQIDLIDEYIHGLRLDWKRFMTRQVATFIRQETAPLRQHAPAVPTTINLMGHYDLYDYHELAPEVDFISWDSYPVWHGQESAATPHWQIGLETTFLHDMFRAMKPDEPFLLLETTPSQVNWRPLSPLKRPGLHRTSSLLAVARGSEGVCYFQFRASRGSNEKFHSAVVNHDGGNDTRVFRDVRDLGQLFQKMQPLLGSRARPVIAVLHDYQNRWALQEMQSPINQQKKYFETCLEHYTPFWSLGQGVDVPGQSADFSRYRLIVAPMLHLLLPGTAERLTAFVENGGILVTTYLTGYVNETDLCFLGGFPGPLRKLLGIRAEEYDALPAFRQVPVEPVPGNRLGLAGSWAAKEVCELIHAETAEVIATYAGEFYAGTPAVTRQATGRGAAYHIAARMSPEFLADFTAAILREAGLVSPLPTPLPVGVTAQTRTADDGREWLFLMNFNETPATVPLGPGTWYDLETAQVAPAVIALPAVASCILTNRPLP
ncbi:MAG: beta-galactosidase, partial [Opitutae bacterium]